MKHPSEVQLACFSGDDLSWTEKLRVGLHVRRCTECAKQVKNFQSAVEQLRAEMGQLPPSLNWDRLAAEMTGNILVGVEAAECVARVRWRPAGVPWRIAATAALSLLVAGAWFMSLPVQERSRTQVAAQVGATPSGIELKANGSTLTLLHRSNKQTVIVSAPGLLRARYIDDDTGQVTINNVYAE